MRCIVFCLSVDCVVVRLCGLRALDQVDAMEVAATQLDDPAPTVSEVPIAPEILVLHFISSQLHSLLIMPLCGHAQTQYHVVLQ